MYMYLKYTLNYATQETLEFGMLKWNFSLEAAILNNINYN